MLKENGRIIIEILIGSAILMCGIIGISKSLGISLRNLNKNLTVVDKALRDYPSNQNSSCVPSNVPGFGKIIKCSRNGTNTSFIVFQR